MTLSFKESERIKAETLIKNESPVFYGGKAGKYFRKLNPNSAIFHVYFLKII